MSQYCWRALVKIISNRFVVGGGMLGAAFLWAVVSAFTCGVAIPVAEQRSLVGGGGPAMSCMQTDVCTICLAPVTCTAVTVSLPISQWTYCDCLMIGVSGCQNMFSHAICSPMPSGTCDHDGGRAACGSFATPEVDKAWIPPAGAVPGSWSCTPRCKPATGASPYCNDCI